MTPKEELARSRPVNANCYPMASRLSPSVIKDSAHFRTYPKPITSEVKHRVKYSELAVWKLDTSSLGNPFGKALNRVLARCVNSGEKHALASALIAQIEKEFQVTFLQAEVPLGCWIQHKDNKNSYLVAGNIDFVLWSKTRRQFMVLELKTKKKNYVNYWYKGRGTSTLWANDLPQAIIYARALRCQLNLSYEPQIMMLLCCRDYAYPRLIMEYGPQDYADHFTWSLQQPTIAVDAATLPTSAMKKGTKLDHVTKDTKLTDLFQEDLTLEGLCTIFNKQLIIQLE